MKFIFPQNYNFSSKLFGIFDYSTILLNILWLIILFFISNIFYFNIYFRIIFFITLSFPILILSIVGFNHENILYVISYLFKYLKSKKLYLYRKIN